MEKARKEVKDRAGLFNGNQILLKADNYLFVGVLASFYFFIFCKRETPKGKPFGLRESKAGQRVRESAASGFGERSGVTGASDARQHPSLAGVSVTADGGH